MKKITKRPDGSLRVQTINEEPTKTQINQQAACDINNIMAQYKKNPDPAIFIKNGKGIYADFSEVSDYHSAMNQLQEANASFMSLPSQIRTKFQNDPGALLSFLNDPANKQEAIELGLIEKPKPSPEITTPPQDPPN